MEKPNKEDLVAMYSPTPDRPSLDPRESAPVKYIVSGKGLFPGVLCALKLLLVSGELAWCVIDL